MNFHLTDNSKQKRSRKSKQNTSHFSFVGFFKIIVIAVLIFLVLNARITLMSKTTILSKNINQIQSRIQTFNRDIAHLRVEKETLCGWKHIKQKIRQFNLALQVPDPYQVRHLGVRVNLPRRAPRNEQGMLVSQR